MMSGLLQFLASGTLGTVRVGIASSEVADKLGPAFQHGLEGDGTEIWKYGPLQVTIANATVAALEIECLEGRTLPPPLQDITIPRSEMALYAFIDLLDENAIGWEIDSSFSFDRQVCVLTQGGVRAYFDLDHRELQSLQA